VTDPPDRGARRARREPLDAPPVRGASDAWLRNERRDRRRRAVRRQRRLAVTGAVLVALAGLALAAGLFRSALGSSRSAARSATVAVPTPVAPIAGATATVSVATRATPAAVPRARSTTRTATRPRPGQPAGPVLSGPPSAVRVPGVRVVHDPIPYGPARRAQMAAYALRHYGVDTARLDPRLIVLHFTDSSTYASAHATFASDTPAPGPAGTPNELPGTCAHFVVDQDGTVYQQAPLDLMCRHAIGVNDRAIGIEMVQAETGSGPRGADRAILDRPAQIRAVLRLVKALQRRYGIATRDVVGHAMANDSRFFHDREGWTNDHSDWQAADVAVVRRRLAALGRGAS
jgi:hypothetical protein